MVMVQFSLNLCYIVQKRGNHHSNIVLKELGKSMLNLLKAAVENVCVINNPQNSLLFLFSFVYSLVLILYQHDFSKVLNS